MQIRFLEDLHFHSVDLKQQVVKVDYGKGELLASVRWSNTNVEGDTRQYCVMDLGEELMPCLQRGDFCCSTFPECPDSNAEGAGPVAGAQ